MGRPRKYPLQQVEELKIDTSEGGLATTHFRESLEAIVEEQPAEEEYVEPTVNHEMNTDPMATPGAALIAVGKFYNDAGMLSAALTKHMRTTAGEPELFSFLQRLQNVLGDFRHAVEQIESGISEHLRNSIEEAVA